jgi:thioester reductase-like protein
MHQAPEDSKYPYPTFTRELTYYAIDDESFATHTGETILNSRIGRKLQVYRKPANFTTMIPRKLSHPVHAKACLKTTAASRMQRMLDRYTASLPHPSEKATPPSSPPHALAIMGSTGFLGPYIVASLLREHPGCLIICFNRTDDGEQRTLSALAKIMGEPRFTSSDLEFRVTDFASRVREPHQDLVAATIPQVREIVFNAWDPNWGKPLGSFESLLEALRRVIDLAVSAAGHPRITFISSICAVGDWPLRHPDSPRIPEEVVWDCDSAMPNGYGQSKCIAEQLLAKAHEIAKLRVNIVRAGQIGGLTSPQCGEWPRQGWLYSIILSAAKFGVFPKHLQSLDWIPVDALAQGIANCIKQSYMTNGLQVFNMVHPEPAKWSLFHEALRSGFGISTEAIDLPDWLQRIEQSGLRIHGFLSAQGSGRETNMFYENTRALEVLPEIKQISQDLLVKWLQGWGLEPRPNL